MITEDRFKDTTLDNSAEIYKPREQLTEKQKISEMTFREKLTYFNNYYRMKTVIIIAVVILAIYFAYSILTPSPETVLYAAVINNAIDEEAAAALTNDFGSHLEINPEKQEIMIDTSFYLGNGEKSEYTLGNEQKLVTYIYAKEIDVIIAPESVFANYAYNGTLCKLSDQLPADLCNTLADSFYYVNSSDNANEGAYGIYLDNASVKGSLADPADRLVLGIVTNSKYKPNAVEFIRYLFKLY